VTRAITSSLIWYRRFCNPWEWARCPPRPTTCNRMAWSSATSCLQSVYSRHYGLDPG
jgi:hypothetical protein